MEIKSEFFTNIKKIDDPLARPERGGKRQRIQMISIRHKRQIITAEC